MDPVKRTKRIGVLLLLPEFCPKLLYAATGDIADPRHPLRYHQIVSNLRQDHYPRLPHADSGTKPANQHESTQLPNAPVQDALQQNSQPEAAGQREKEHIQAEAQSSSVLPENQEPKPSTSEQSNVQLDMQSSHGQQTDGVNDDSNLLEPLSVQAGQLPGFAAADHTTAGLPPHITHLQGLLNDVSHEGLSPDEQASRASLQSRITKLAALLDKIQAGVDSRTQRYSQGTSAAQKVTSVFTGIQSLDDLYQLSLQKEVSRGGPEGGGQVSWTRL